MIRNHLVESYWQGYDAYKDGKNIIIDNPYPLKDTRHISWCNGYNEAAEDSRSFQRQEVQHD